MSEVAGKVGGVFLVLGIFVEMEFGVDLVLWVVLASELFGVK